jgi:hypothetical protein
MERLDGELVPRLSADCRPVPVGHTGQAAGIDVGVIGKPHADLSTICYPLTAASFGTPAPPMRTRTPEQTVRQYFEAVAARDFELARSYLGDGEFSYASPLGTFTSADAFIADLWRVGPILESVELRRVFVDGDTVCSILNFRTSMPDLQIVPAAHLATVKAGKIVAVEVFFDASHYLKMFDVD